MKLNIRTIVLQTPREALSISSGENDMSHANTSRGCLVPWFYEGSLKDSESHRSGQSKDLIIVVPRFGFSQGLVLSMGSREMREREIRCDTAHRLRRCDQSGPREMIS